VSRVPAIDAHQGFWDHDHQDHAWPADELAALGRSFGPDDLRPELELEGLSGSILVAASASGEGVRQALAMARGSTMLRGVVGWVDLASGSLGRAIESLRSSPGGHKLVGFSHRVCDEADPAWLERVDVRQGLSAVAGSGLAFDVLARTRDLPAVAAAARALPELHMVLVHLACPPIASGDLTAWGRALLPLAELPNVSAKISGLVTEADWHTWSIDDLRHPVELALDVFGPDRLMVGSDWPHCLLAGSYSDVIDSVRYLVADLAEHEQADIRGGTAARVYRLPLDPGSSHPA
jgi:L-fuconolactonase